MRTYRRRKHRKNSTGIIALFLLVILIGAILIFSPNSSCSPGNTSRGYIETSDVNVNRELKKEGIPAFYQFDRRWGDQIYGDKEMSITACGPTCLSMVYCGLTRDANLHPLAMARLAQEKGYYVNGSGSSWNMMSELAESLGLDVHDIAFTRESILQELEQGHPIICIMGPGDFTDSGHFIVLVQSLGDGMVEIRDPNSKENTRKDWEIDLIMSQTRNLWSYSLP